MSDDGDQNRLRPVTLDLSEARRNLGCDENLLCEIANVFIEDVPELIDKLQAACLSNDYETVGLLAHSLKGLCATFGAEPARSIAQRLEADASHSGTTVTMEKLYPLIETLHQTISVLQRELRLSA